MKRSPAKPLLMAILLPAILAAAAAWVYFQYLPPMRMASLDRHVTELGRRLNTGNLYSGGNHAHLRSAELRKSEKTIIFIPDIDVKFTPSVFKPWTFEAASAELSGIELKFDDEAMEINASGLPEFIDRLTDSSLLLLKRGRRDFHFAAAGLLVPRAGDPQPFQLQAKRRGDGFQMRFATRNCRIGGTVSGDGEALFKAEFAAAAANLPQWLNPEHGYAEISGEAQFTCNAGFKSGIVTPEKIVMTMLSNGTLAWGGKTITVDRGAEINLEKGAITVSRGSLDGGEVKFQNLQAAREPDGKIAFSGIFNLPGRLEKLTPPLPFKLPAVKLSGHLAGDSASIKGEAPAEGGGMEFTIEKSGSRGDIVFRLAAAEFPALQATLAEAVFTGNCSYGDDGTAWSVKAGAKKIEAEIGGGRLTLDKIESSLLKNGRKLSGKAKAGEWSFVAGELRETASGAEFDWSFDTEKDSLALSGKADTFMYGAVKISGADFKSVYGKDSSGASIAGNEAEATLYGGKLKLKKPELRYGKKRQSWKAGSAEYRDAARYISSGALEFSRESAKSTLKLDKVSFTAEPGWRGEFDGAALADGKLALFGGKITFAAGDTGAGLEFDDTALTQSFPAGGGVLSIGRLTTGFGTAGNLELVTTLDKGIMHFFGAGKSEFRSGKSLLASGFFDTGEKAGKRFEAAFKLPPLPLQTPMAPGVIAKACGDMKISGSAGFDGTLEAAGTKITAVLTLRLAGAELEANDGFLRFSGLNGALPVLGVDASKAETAMSFAAARCGFFLNFGEGQLTLKPEKTAFIMTQLEGSCGGGKAVLKQDAAFAVPEMRSLRFSGSELDLSGFVPGISARGGGELTAGPENLSAALKAENGRLDLSKMAGFVKKDGTDATTLDFALAALAGFDFTVLKVGLEADAENTALKIEASGRPDKVLPFIYSPEEKTFLPAISGQKGFSGEVTVNAEYLVPAKVKTE